jgi:conjugal transfer pilus assembly protein TraW
MSCIAFASHSKSLGVVGVTFPIREMSFLDFIELRLKTLANNGALDAMQSQWQEQASLKADRPTPIGLPRATTKRQFHYDLSMRLNHDILDAKGRIIFPTGMYVNPLAERPGYAPCWLFFNGDDKAQMHWAQQEMSRCIHAKLILTGGSVHEAELTLDAVIYFDQSAHLSSRFQLHAVPARITRDKDRLRIEELVIKENGDAI